MNRKKIVDKWWAKLFSKKILLTVSALTLVLSGVVGGTVAWMLDSSTVTNTFTYGDIDIELVETDTAMDGDENAATNLYKMMPGKVLFKDPTVIVTPGSEPSWLFAELVHSTNFDDFLGYEIASDWSPLPGADGVYYMALDQQAEEQRIPVLKDNSVKVHATVTKEALNAITDYPQLIITAYAVQRDDTIAAIDTPEEAWALAKP